MLHLKLWTKWGRIFLDDLHPSIIFQTRLIPFEVDAATFWVKAGNTLDSLSVNHRATRRQTVVHTPHIPIHTLGVINDLQILNQEKYNYFATYVSLLFWQLHSLIEASSHLLFSCT